MDDCGDAVGFYDDDSGHRLVLRRSDASQEHVERGDAEFGHRGGD